MSRAERPLRSTASSSTLRYGHGIHSLAHHNSPRSATLLLDFGNVCLIIEQRQGLCSSLQQRGHTRSQPWTRETKAPGREATGLEAANPASACTVRFMGQGREHENTMMRRRARQSPKPGRAAEGRRPGAPLHPGRARRPWGRWAPGRISTGSRPCSSPQRSRDTRRTSEVVAAALMSSSTNSSSPSGRDRDPRGTASGAGRAWVDSHQLQRRSKSPC